MADARIEELDVPGRLQDRTPRQGPTVVVDDIHVVYRVYKERRQGLRELVSGRFRRRASEEIHALRGVSLVAERGESIGVIGSNGSGKSTLMQSIAGALPPTRGAVYAGSKPMLLGVGAALKKELSGRRNIVIGLLALGLPRVEVDELYEDIVNFSSLGDAINRPLGTYSSGMRARLQFAISTAVRPEILLLDEATAVGDQEFKQKSNERIRDLCAQAGTVFLVTHSLPEVRATCSRAIWIEDGRVMQEGAPSDVVAAYKRSNRQFSA